MDIISFIYLEIIIKNKKCEWVNIILFYLKIVKLNKDFENLVFMRFDHKLL